MKVQSREGISAINGSNRLVKKRRAKKSFMERGKFFQKSDDAPDMKLQSQDMGRRSITSHCSSRNIQKDFTSIR